MQSGAVTKQYSDAKLALVVNELMRKIYLITTSLSNLRADMIFEGQRTAVASVNSKQDEKIQEMLGKIELNVLGLGSFWRETTEPLQTIFLNLQTDMISRIDAERTAAASAHSNYDEKIVEMVGKIQLNVSGLVNLYREKN